MQHQHASNMMHIDAADTEKLLQGRPVKVDPSLGETCTLTGDGHEKIPPATRRPALVARGGRNLSWLQRERDRVTFSSDLEEVRVFKTDSWDRDEEAS